MSASASTGSTDLYAAAVARLEHAIDELGELLLDQFIWKRTEQIALANTRMLEKPFYITWIGTNYYRRAAAAVRAMVDTDRRSDSLVSVLNWIAENAAAITPSLAVPDLLDAAGRRLDPQKIRAEADRLRDSAEAVRKYVNQNLAHLDRNQRAPIPTVVEVDHLILEIVAVARRYYLAVTGSGYEIEPRVQFDWTDVLHFPWIE